MSTSQASTFTAGLVQMRSGLSPQANLDAAVKLIGEAKAAGADYVLTPEMTNILEIKRERLFAAIVAEESDASLAAFRELARKLGIFLHVGSLAIKLSPDKAANRSFLIDRARRDRRPLRQDPHVRRRSRQRRELSRIAQLPARRDRRGRRPAVGPARAHRLLRPALPRALPRAGGGRRTVSWRFRRPSPGRPARRIGTCSIARAPSRTAAFVLAAAQGGKHENGRETFGHSLVVDPWGRILAEGGTEPGVVLADDRSGRGRRPRAAEFPRCSMGGASRSSSRWRSRPICTRCEARHDPLRARSATTGTRSRAGSRTPRPTTSRPSAGSSTCPACGSTKVEKALMAPRLSGTRKRGTRATAPAHDGAPP